MMKGDTFMVQTLSLTKPANIFLKPEDPLE